MNENIVKLINEITNCPYICNYFNNKKYSDCQGIIESQNAASINDFQLPEPWRGELDKAKILVISSNPAISPANINNPTDEQFPRSNWSIQERINFYNYSFKYYIKDGIHYKMNNNDFSRKSVRYWSHIKKQTGRILQRPSKPGEDYCLTEVVHCKSAKAEGVIEALKNCKLYFKNVLQISPAKLLVIVGKKAEYLFKNIYGIRSNDKLLDPLPIEGQSRMVLFLMSPTAVSTGPKIIDEGYLSQDELNKLYEFVKKNIDKL